MVLVSACLLGIKCKYDGGDNYRQEIIEQKNKEILIPVCPEQLGGLSVPRPPAEIICCSECASGPCGCRNHSHSHSHSHNHEYEYEGVFVGNGIGTGPGDGADVLKGKGVILTEDGRDVTEYFVRGAGQVLYIARLMHISRAWLKQGSPSCGCGLISDGTFSGRKRRGDGITTALLKAKGLEVKAVN